MFEGRHQNENLLCVEILWG